MTDPIRIQCVSCSDETGVHIHAPITPDIARQIVQLADFRPAPGTTLLPLPHDSRIVVTNHNAYKGAGQSAVSVRDYRVERAECYVPDGYRAKDQAAHVSADKPKLAAIAVFQNDDGTIDYQLSLTNGILFVDEKDGQITDIMHAFGGTSVEYHHEARVAELEAKLAEADIVRAQRDALLQEEGERAASSVHHDSLVAQVADLRAKLEHATEEAARLREYAGSLEKGFSPNGDFVRAEVHHAARAEAAQWKERAEKAEQEIADIEHAIPDDDDMRTNAQVIERAFKQRDAARAEADRLRNAAVALTDSWYHEAHRLANSCDGHRGTYGPDVLRRCASDLLRAAGMDVQHGA